MLATMPYADVLAVYNAIAERPARKFETLAIGRARTQKLLDTKKMTLSEAARLADVVLPSEPPPKVAPGEDNGPELLVRMTAAEIISVSQLLRGDFPAALNEPARDTILAKLASATLEPVANPRGTKQPNARVGGMTSNQRTIIKLCERPEGATGKEMADGCGWPSIAARATCTQLAERFGYTLSEKPKSGGRGITFHMTPEAPLNERK